MNVIRSSSRGCGSVGNRPDYGAVVRVLAWCGQVWGSASGSSPQLSMPCKRHFHGAVAGYPQIHGPFLQADIL